MNPKIKESSDPHSFIMLVTFIATVLVFVSVFVMFQRHDDTQTRKEYYDAISLTTGEKRFLQLSAHYNEDIRCAVGANPATPDYIVERLKTDKNAGVRACAEHGKEQK